MIVIGQDDKGNLYPDRVRPLEGNDETRIGQEKRKKFAATFYIQIAIRIENENGRILYKTTIKQPYLVNYDTTLELLKIGIEN